ncbi:helix-turn-helix domain-containing protein [Haladaptatus caseinilyticus]|uniref:helix-turn-helix domain-containing protein n=1 Tax=Haladaptatus caseinilyticus TaxID=2993314 RepID=UPI00224AFD30|nr:helix-turn-helix domain-containing protein [Haladaptatus caseinilyticus]
MREFIFTIEYDPGIDPITDIFIDYPATMAKSLACCVTARSMWRVDRITGPTDALSSLETIYLDSKHCNECLGSRNCHTPSEYAELDSDTNQRTIYTYQPEIEGCHSVPYRAAQQLGDGLLFQTTRNESQYEWRILMRDKTAVGELYDTIQQELRDGVRIELDQLGTPAHWCEEAVTIADLPYAQREALIAAVEQGYYETPRETSVEDIADSVGVPRSTLQYRLQRAESWLATRFMSESYS